MLCIFSKKKHVLTVKLNNEPIEHQFSLNRSLSGHYLALDVESFTKNELILLLQVIAKLCTNPDGVHNKVMQNKFFEAVHVMSKIQENNEMNRLKKWEELDSLQMAC